MFSVASRNTACFLLYTQGVRIENEPVDWSKQYIHAWCTTWQQPLRCTNLFSVMATSQLDCRSSLTYKRMYKNNILLTKGSISMRCFHLFIHSDIVCECGMWTWGWKFKDDISEDCSCASGEVWGDHFRWRILIETKEDQVCPPIRLPCNRRAHVVQLGKRRKKWRVLRQTQSFLFYMQCHRCDASTCSLEMCHFRGFHDPNTIMLANLMGNVNISAWNSVTSSTENPIGIKMHRDIVLSE